MKLKSVKFWNIAGVIVGVAIIILGIVVANTPADTYSTVSSKTATFGGDYYTYQYEASKNTVTNTAATANNLREIGEKLTLYAGLFFVVAGVLVMLYYLKKFFLEEDYSFEDEELSEEEIMEIMNAAAEEFEENDLIEENSAEDAECGSEDTGEAIVSE